MPRRTFASHLLALPALVAALAFAPSAHADIPPPDACNTDAGWFGASNPGQEGQPCENAGPNGSAGAGVCVKETCHHTGPLPDGGIGQTDMPCYLCIAADAGPDAATDAPGDAHDTPDANPNDGATDAPEDSAAPKDASSPDDSGTDAGHQVGPSPTPDAGPGLGKPPGSGDNGDSGGCTLSPAHRDEGIGGAMLAIGFGALFLGRRKKR
jgi:MYXO-CTERM domain-containing protein